MKKRSLHMHFKSAATVTFAKYEVLKNRPERARLYH